MEDDRRRQLEGMLRESEERYVSLLNASPDGIAILDLKGHVLMVSRMALTMLAFRREEDLIGRPITDFIVPEHRARAVSRIALMFEGTLTGAGEYRGLRADGTTFDIEVNGEFVRDEQGQPVRIVFVVRDVTLRRQAEAALQAVEERNRTILQTAMDGFWVADLQGRLLEVNDTYSRMSGYSGPELLSMGIPDLVTGDTLEIMATRVARIVERGQDRFESRHRRKDGSLFDVEASVQYQASDGGRLVAFLRDITERRQAEAATAAALREKEGLLKEVHHRVKNNLQVITSLLRLETTRSVEPDTRRVLKDMQSRILSMALLHETLYKSGRFGRVDLGSYLRQLCQQFFRAQASTSEPVRLVLELSTVDVEIDQAIPCGLIVNELLTNSLKHAFPAGRGGDVRVGLSSRGGEVQIRVSDNGVGLPRDLESRRSQSLGLQLISDLSRQLLGELAIGPASTFTITFPSRLHETGIIPPPPAS